MTTDDTKIAGLRSKERSRDHDLQPSLKQMTKQVWRKSLNRTSVNIAFDVLCLCLRQIQKIKPITMLAVQKYLNQCKSTLSLSSSMRQCNAGEHFQCRGTFAMQGNICNAREYLQCRGTFSMQGNICKAGGRLQHSMRCLTNDDRSTVFSLIEAQSVRE